MNTLELTVLSNNPGQNMQHIVQFPKCKLVGDRRAITNLWNYQLLWDMEFLRRILKSDCAFSLRNINITQEKRESTENSIQLLQKYSQYLSRWLHSSIVRAQATRNPFFFFFFPLYHIWKGIKILYLDEQYRKEKLPLGTWEISIWFCVTAWMWNFGF